MRLCLLVSVLTLAEVYTQSEPFEIKPEGATYATVPSGAASSAAGTLSAASGSGVPSGSAAPSATKAGGAMANAVPAVAAVALGAAAYIMV